MKKLLASTLILATLTTPSLFAKENPVFPIRETATHLGYNITWNDKDKTVTILTPTQSVVAQADVLSYTKNNFLTCELVSPLELIDNQLYAPLSFWEDALNLSITTENGTPCLTDKLSPNDLLDDIIMPLNEEANTYYVNQKVGLSLEENPSTGYIWAVDIPLGIQVISDTYTPTSTELVGSSGTHSWIMRATKPGTYTLIFKKLRPFEPNEVIEMKTYTLNAKTFTIPK